MAWLRRNDDGCPPFCVIDDPDRLTNLAQSLGWDVSVTTLNDASDAPAVFGTSLPVVPIRFPAPTTPGRPDPSNAATVIAGIEQAVDLIRTGACAAVTTSPVQKSVLYEAGFAHPGQTEFLGQLSGPHHRPVMLLAGPDLRVVPVTIHLPLASVASALSKDAIVKTGLTLAAGLKQDFAIDDPRLAVAALNPHAGEDGTLGREELEIIGPAVESLRAQKVKADGPFPADTLFHADARAHYDAVLCMYHDQALIPLKTLDLWSGVNVTLGLSFIRTSPDHGTALDLAGRGLANPESLIQAIRLAAGMAENRIRYAERTLA